MGESSWKAEVLLTGSWRGATSVLLTNSRLCIVVDTGLPHEAHQLVDALKIRGLKPADIKIVMNTHYHVDHVLNNYLFGASAIYGSQESYEWCRALYADLVEERRWVEQILKYYPETFEYDHAEKNMAKLRKFTLRWWDLNRLGDPAQYRWTESTPLPEGIEGLVTHGHVPGHVSLIVPGGEQRIVIAGDALVTRDHDDQVLTMIPHNRKQYQLDRARILSLGGRIIPGHEREFYLSQEAPAKSLLP